jgi:hypothetical protein
VSVRRVRADLAAAPVVRVALLAAAQLPRLVLKVAAVVDQIAHALQREAGATVAAIKFCFRVAGEDDRFVIWIKIVKCTSRIGVKFFCNPANLSFLPTRGILKCIQTK